MIKKVKELFVLRKPKNQKSKTQQKEQNLYDLRTKQTKQKYQKLNINLIFNKAQYKSYKDNPQELLRRKNHMIQILNKSQIDMGALTNLSWNGIQYKRETVWKILLGHLSDNPKQYQYERKKHAEQYRKLYLENNINEAQRKYIIQIDIPRTFCDISIFELQWVRLVLKKVLCLWDIVGKGGYLQGMSDIAAIIFLVLIKYDEDQNLQYFKTISQQEKQLLQSDLYYLCLKVFTKFFGYYAICDIKNVDIIMNRIQNIITRSDEHLAQHFKNNGVVIIQFAFRWIYVLLSRELPLRLVFRLLDSYFSSSQDFDKLHSFVVSSLVLRFSFTLLKLKGFNEIIKLLQSLPTNEWTKKDIEMLVEESIVLMNTFNSE